MTTRTGPVGTYLTDQSGRTLYLFVADKGTASTCSGKCAHDWPPVTGTAKAAGAVTAAQLGTSRRADGKTQVTYDGHPLYYYDDDKAAGTTKGQGAHEFGDLWWVVGSDGKAITSTRSAKTGAAPTVSRSKY